MIESNLTPPTPPAAAQPQADQNVGAVLVCGAGITGIQAALDLAGSQFKVYLVDASPAIGGRMAELDKTFPTGDCAMCILSPKLVEIARNRNIEIITLAEVQSVTGRPGDFRVAVRRAPRYVDAKKCNACGDCAEACPISLPNEFDRAMGTRKAVFRPYPQAIPNIYGISKAPAKAPCRVACPAGVNAQGYVALIAQRKFQEAYDLIRERCPVPAVCGRICHHPCQGQCNRSEIDQPVAVRDLKRFAADWVYQHRDELDAKPAEPVKTYDQKVAIIGGGPAGLTAAHDLTSRGYRVTIFEARDFLGGMLRLGVPAYRLPRDVLDYEIAQLTDNERTEVAFNRRLGRDITIEGLKADGYAAVFVATGAHKSRTVNLPGGDARGVMYGLDFLCRANLGQPVEIGRHAVIVGGGNVAMDAARAALRLGAEKATIVYRRGREEMPALAEEIEQAEAEGVAFELLANPVRVIAGGDHAVMAVECLRMKLGDVDASGRRRPVPVEGSEFSIQADTVILAIGQAADVEGLPLAGDKVAADASLATGIEGVFAGGDVVLGPATLVEAMAHGHRGADAICAYLRGETPPPPPAKDVPVAGNPDPDAPAKGRQAMPRTPMHKRLAGFDEIDLGYTVEQAVAEASRCLACGLCSECMQCVKACAAGAIDHNQKPVTETLRVGSIVLTPGFEEFQASLRGEFGHGRYANVLSSVQFERMLSAAGPTGGKVVRPSDGQPVRRIAFIQCVGSRDSARGLGYCSSICCMSATKEAMVALEHVTGLEVSIFCMDVRAFGKEFDAYVNRARDEHGVKYIRAMPSRIVQMPGTLNPRVRYLDAGGQEIHQEFDLAVLSVGMRPGGEVKALAERLGVDLNEFGFCRTDRLTPMQASRGGIYVAGAFQEPKDIPESVAQASAAASCAMEQLAASRGTLITRHDYPWERDVTDEEPRIGVFVCHCGHNIASVVDVEAVTQRAAAMAGVCYAEADLYTCSDTNQQHIRDMIREHRLNRLVVASCSPRTHEPLFQETLRESGLNPYLFAMTNIRDQCSWVHRDDHAAATAKATDLMRMAVARARHLKALPTGQLPVTQSALVLGGGLAGMTAALAIAEQGFEVHLVEKQGELGGNLRRLHTTLEGADVAKFLADLVARVQAHAKITVHLSSTPAQIAGHVGNFKSRIATTAPADGDGSDGTEAGKTTEQIVAHGVVLVATGGQERTTEKFLHGKHPRVLTQRELEDRLAGGKVPADLGPAPTVVMIQCVESRDAEHPYCSRVCCGEAVKNALEIKRQMPRARVFILGRDIRTYGFRETYFQQAREAGVLLVRHDEDAAPLVSDDDGGLTVSVTDAALGRELLLRPDLLVLSAGIAPGEDNPVLSGLLRSALTSDGFFLEAHPKLRPVDLANEGEFLCGLAHSPRFMDETIAHARAAAGRAATVLSNAFLQIPGQVAHVDPVNCVACATCVKVCPYGAPQINDVHKAEIQTAKCMGCGSCAAACPAHTISLKHQEDSQVEAMLDELLVNGDPA